MLSISFGRWDTASLLQMFEFPAFQKKQGLGADDVQRIRGWIQAAEIRWGEDSEHRNELLSSSLVDNSPVGTWKQGMDRLLLGLAMINSDEDAERELLPLSILETTQGELLGKWIVLMRSLREDLKPLSDGSRMSLKEWSIYLKSLLEAYFFLGSMDNSTENEIQTVYDLIHSFDIEFRDEAFSFATIKHHLEAAANKQRVCYRESHLHAVKFCSLLPMCAVPAKVVVLLGMEEGIFPRVDLNNSLNSLRGSPYGDYCPTNTDFDRYLFLETLLSARQYFIVTYTGYSRDDNKEQLPSLLVTELLSYLDKGYTFSGKTPSERVIRRHPFQAYDKILFEEGSSFKSYSEMHYQAAKAFYKAAKQKKHCFIPHFSAHRMVKEDHQEGPIDLWQLSLMARNPIEAYFNLTLGMYLEKEEERIVKTDEDFFLKALDSAILKKRALAKPLESVLNAAEKEGRLPLGPFKNYAIGRVKSDVEDIYANLTKLGIDRENIFKMDFSLQYEKENRTESGIWKLPPLEIVFKGQSLLISGSFREVVAEGLVTYNKDDKKEILKTWPQYLVFNCLVSQYALPIKKGLIFAKSGKVKEPFFSDPFKALETYLEYYFHALENISPLIPEWVPDLIEKDEP
ncbi:MAG: exodeoxyribonuclease V subunit gamma, partial [Waddliaceae bacterium]